MLLECCGFFDMQMVVPLLIFVVLWISKQKALSEGMPLFAASNFIYYFLFSISLGSSPFFMRSVFVMCAACLAGTALMIVKKSRDKPIGYTLLASGSQE